MRDENTSGGMKYYCLCCCCCLIFLPHSLPTPIRILLMIYHTKSWRLFFASYILFMKKSWFFCTKVPFDGWKIIVFAGFHLLLSSIIQITWFLFKWHSISFRLRAQWAETTKCLACGGGSVKSSAVKRRMKKFLRLPY